jgi:hypothetical protein
MPAALIDSTIVLRLLAARLVAGVTGADVTQLGEAPVKAIALGGVEIRFLALNIVRERRSFADAAPSDGTFEAVIEVVVDADQMEASADNLTRYAMAVVAALDQQRMTDAGTTHEVLCEQADEENATGDDPEDRIVGVAMVRASGRLRRESGRTVVAP